MKQNPSLKNEIKKPSYDKTAILREKIKHS